jgi:hypothetical protein
VQPPKTRGTNVSGGGIVDVLAGDHPPGTTGPSELEGRGQEVFRRRFLAGEQEREGLAVKGVASQDRDVLAKRAVAGGPPAPQVIVVHRGQVVVDQAARARQARLTPGLPSW